MTKTHDGQEDQTASVRKYMRGWMSQETARLRLLLPAAVLSILFFLIPYSSLRGRSTMPAIIGFAVFLFVFLLLPRLLCARFFVKHSAIGRQIQSFGDFDTVYNEIILALCSPLYTNGTEVITEKYIFLMPQKETSLQATAFQNTGRLLILPVEQLTRVSIKPNEPYPDEMNTILFRTIHPSAHASFANGLYTMTVHLDAAATAELVAAVTANIQSPASKEESGYLHTPSLTYNSPRTVNSYPYKSTHSPAARSAARFRSDPLRQLLAGKMRVFRIVVILIVLVNVGTILFTYFMSGGTLSTMPRDFARFIHRELLNNSRNLLFLLGLFAFYLIPIISVYVMIKRWYRGFLAQYNKLPQQEQQELLAKLCDTFETGKPPVIYTQRCFCFHDTHRLSFQILLPYSSVHWIYRSHSFFRIGSPTPGLDTEVNFYRTIVRTADRKKYCIPSGDEPKLSKRVPDAITGYGDIQREAYLDRIRSLKR